MQHARIWVGGDRGGWYDFLMFALVPISVGRLSLRVLEEINSTGQPRKPVNVDQTTYSAHPQWRTFMPHDKKIHLCYCWYESHFHALYDCECFDVALGSGTPRRRSPASCFEKLQSSKGSRCKILSCGTTWAAAAPSALLWPQVFCVLDFLSDLISDPDTMDCKCSTQKYTPVNGSRGQSYYPAGATLTLTMLCLLLYCSNGTMPHVGMIAGNLRYFLWALGARFKQVDSFENGQNWSFK